MDKHLIRISKFLSFVLRRPETTGLSLNYGGWANVEELLSRSKLSGVTLTKELL